MASQTPTISQERPRGVALDKVGTVGTAAGLSVVEGGSGAVRQTVINFDEFSQTITDALAYASTKVYDFPKGRILVLGSTGSLVFTVTSTQTSTLNNGATLDWAVGTAAASSTTLATTMVDLLAKVSPVLSAAQDVANTASSGALASSAQFDGTSTAKDAYLNFAVPTGGEIDGDATVQVDGNIVITWVLLGDYADLT